MFDFSNFLDLPLIWGFLIATAVFLYVLLDGFDLGCGILFPFAPNDKARSTMMNSIAPFWDGNETWLVLGGGGLFVAFPPAYGILLSALYMPIILMLLGLIFRGVAFEFRFKASTKNRHIWDIAFHGGSLVAAFMQGIILGNFVQGVTVDGRSFAGGGLDWANGFAIFTGFAVIFGYALLGATWLIMKSDGDLQTWARSAAKYVLAFVAIAMAVVSISMPFVDERIWQFWFTSGNFLFLLPLPLITGFLFIRLWQGLNKGHEFSPFISSTVLFLLGYLGLGLSLYPWIVPFEMTLWDAAAASASLSLMLVGTVIFLPIILGYTAYSYYTFRGKADHEPLY